MATDDSADPNEVGFGRNSSQQGSYVTPRAVVVLRFRANQIVVKIDSICGCTDIERLSRIPGAPKSVKGLILFKGEAIPLMSFFGGASERSPRERLTQKGKTNDYAVIFSIKGVRFAARVDELPRICADISELEKVGSNACYMRRKHLERLFGLCVARGDGDDRVASCHERNGGSRENGVAQANGFRSAENTHGTEGHNHGTERETETKRETTPAIADPCCAT